MSIGTPTSIKHLGERGWYDLNTNTSRNSTRNKQNLTLDYLRKQKTFYIPIITSGHLKILQILACAIKCYRSNK